MAKRATLPQANDLLIGRRAERTGQQKSAAQEPYDAPQPAKTQISAYLTEPTLKRLEEVKYRLYAEHNLKVKKSDLIEAALAEGLSDTDRLVHLFKNR